MITIQNSLISKNPVFRHYWGSMSLSYIGDMASFIIFPLIAVISLNASVSQIGFLTALEPLPMLFVGPVIGSWIDKSRSQIKFMRWSAIFRAVAVATVPLAATVQQLTYWYLCLIAVLVGFSGIFFSVASSAILPRICAKSELITANSISQFSFSLAAIIGPSCGGFLTQIFGATHALLIDAMAYCIAALFTSRIIYIQPVHISPITESTKNSIFTSLYNIISHKIQGGLIIETATAAFANTSYYMLLNILAIKELGLRTEQIGIAMGLGASGALLGTLLTPFLSRKLGIGPSLILGAIIYSGILLITPFLSKNNPAQATMIITLTEIFSGAGLIFSQIAASSIQQSIIPTAQLGSARGIFLASQNIGKVLAGLIAAGIGSFLGIRDAMFICLLIGAMGGIFLLFTPVITLRTLD